MHNDYEISKEADIDVDKIFEFTVLEFGYLQAIQYHEEFMHLFNQLVDFPFEGKPRKELQRGIRSVTKGSHIVFYKNNNEKIFIVRILHHSQDANEIFKK